MRSPSAPGRAPDKLLLISCRRVTRPSTFVVTPPQAPIGSSLAPVGVPFPVGAVCSGVKLHQGGPVRCHRVPEGSGVGAGDLRLVYGSYGPVGVGTMDVVSAGGGKKFGMADANGAAAGSGTAATSGATSAGEAGVSSADDTTAIAVCAGATASADGGSPSDESLHAVRLIPSVSTRAATIRGTSRHLALDMAIAPPSPAP